MDHPISARLSPGRDSQPALISTSAELEALVARLALESFVTVDTEFIRERTYWPQLCLVQIAGEQETAVIDALAPGLDIAPLGRLLADPAVTKVFHAARQDVEIFLLLFGRVPVPLFDTQVAAMVAGYGDQVGYDQLVASLTGASIDKAHRFSDWSARPLSPAQIAYAASDVTHLRTVYERLVARLSREGRDCWVEQEMAALADPATYRNEPETMWQRLKSRTSSRRVLGQLRAIAAWREREAQRINIPRGRVLKDEALLELAASAPASPAELARVRGINRGFAEGRSGASLLAAIAAAKTEPEEALPPARSARNEHRAEPALVALLKVLLAAKCADHHVAPRLVASAEEIERFAAGGETDLPLLLGWRREVFGADALALRAGGTALGVDERGRVKTLPL
ncbi:MAG: ribonuclease D [Acetobacteraceae bacterium]